MITDTSLDAFVSLETRYNATIRRRILNLLSESPEPLNNRKIGKLLRLPINTITGRTNELLNEGLVIRVWKARDEETGRLAYKLALANLEEA